jgi:putative Mg2+ transporter-C (MgtC) family protein
VKELIRNGASWYNWYQLDAKGAGQRLGKSLLQEAPSLFSNGTAERARGAIKDMKSSLTMITAELHVWMLIRLLIAVLLGALVGYERERQGKSAGLRTHAMVGLGATLFTVVSLYGFGPGTDTSRVAAMIVSGIGFLGAGAILHERGGVQGLTTAASLWVTAAIGIAVGVGMILMSLATTLLVFAVLRFAPNVRHKTPQDDSVGENRTGAEVIVGDQPE